MDTIEERAAQVSTRVIEMCALQRFGEDGCGCTHEIERALKAQQEIDIQRACNWLIANGYFLVGHKEIEYFKQAMKGK